MVMYEATYKRLKEKEPTTMSKKAAAKKTTETADPRMEAIRDAVIDPKPAKEAKPAKAAKAKPAPKAKAAKKAASKAKATAKKAAAPANGKGATILAMIARKGGATATELQEATGWQPHSVRGFISTAGKKGLAKITSAKREDGQRVYSA